MFLRAACYPCHPPELLHCTGTGTLPPAGDSFQCKGSMRQHGSQSVSKANGIFFKKLPVGTGTLGNIENILHGSIQRIQARPASETWVLVLSQY